MNPFQKGPLPKSTWPDPPKMPEVEKRTLHLRAAIRALELADKAWNEQELDIWLKAADVFLDTVRK